MSSNHGADTARVMDDMRRQTKKKQAKKTVIAGKAELEDVRLPTTLNAKFGGATAASIAEFFKENPSQMITTDDIRQRFVKGETIYVEGTDDFLPTLKGTVIAITKDGIDSPLTLYQVNVWLGGGFGLIFNKDRYGKVYIY